MLDRSFRVERGIMTWVCANADSTKKNACTCNGKLLHLNRILTHSQINVTETTTQQAFVISIPEVSP